jgi:hypothetical protein
MESGRATLLHHSDIVTRTYRLLDALDAGNAEVSLGVFENLLLGVCKFFLPHLDAVDSRRICQVRRDRCVRGTLPQWQCLICLCTMLIYVQEEALRSSLGQPTVTIAQANSTIFEIVESWTATDDVRSFGVGWCIPLFWRPVFVVFFWPTALLMVIRLAFVAPACLTLWMLSSGRYFCGHPGPPLSARNNGQHSTRVITVGSNRTSVYSALKSVLLSTRCTKSHTDQVMLV